ncbi:hypothetical protein ACFXA9_30030, partial [Streptomyces sp. NPDC059411]
MAESAGPEPHHETGPDRSTALRRPVEPGPVNEAPGTGAAGRPRSALTPAAVVALQRRAGNGAVRAMLGATGATGATARAPGGPRATGATGATGGPVVQRAADGGQQAEIASRADSVAAEARETAAEHEGEPPPQPDPAAKAEARARQQGNFAQPDRVSGPASQVRSTA